MSAIEAFKTLLFGVAGLSVIFWAAVIGIWHVDMFPRFFKEDRTRDMTPFNFSNSSSGQDDTLMGNKGALRPSMQTSTGLISRDKYSRKSIVVADFSPIESGYGVNRLYSSILLALGVITFVIITYGLHSAMFTMI